MTVKKSEVEFINVKTLDDLYMLQDKFQSYPDIKSENAIDFSKLNPEIKWRAYYQVQNASKYKNLVSFSYYGKVVRGIATGANDYFTFNQSKAQQFNINEKYMLPCITKAIDVQESFFTKADFEYLKQKDRHVYLLNATEPNEPSLKKILD